MDKNIANKHNPLFKEQQGLQFDNINDPITILTEDQKVDKFLSKYLEVVNPVSTYKSYFESSAKEINHILKEIKNYYKKLVLNGTWSEKKYVLVINDIFENKMLFSVNTLDISGLKYDKGTLENKSGNTKRRRL